MNIIALLFFHVFLILYGGYFLSTEFILYPYLTTNGFTPYSTLIDQHLPLIFFGPLSLPFWLVSSRPLLLGLFITLLLLTDIFFYLSIKKKTNQAFFFTFSFIVLTWHFQGNFFWLSTFITFFLSLTLFLLSFKSKPILFLQGFILGLIFLIKPTLLPAILFFIFYFSLLNPMTVFGLITPVFITILYLSKLNLFSDFYDLVVGFNRDFYVPLAKKMPNKRQLLMLVLVFISPLYFLFKKNIISLVLPLLFLIIAFPRFEYLHLSPFILLLLYLTSTHKLNKNQFFVLAVLTTLIFILTLIKLKNFRYGDFYLTPAAVKDTEEINTLENQEVLILGGPELIYVLANKLPPKPYVPILPWYLANKEYQEYLIDTLFESTTPVVYYPDAQVDGIPISSYTNFLTETLENRYNRTEKDNYYLYLPK